MQTDLKGKTEAFGIAYKNLLFRWNTSKFRGNHSEVSKIFLFIEEGMQKAIKSIKFGYYGLAIIQWSEISGVERGSLADSLQIIADWWLFSKMWATTGTSPIPSHHDSTENILNITIYYNRQINASLTFVSTWMIKNF